MDSNLALQAAMHMAYHWASSEIVFEDTKFIFDIKIEYNYYAKLKENRGFEPTPAQKTVRSLNHCAKGEVFARYKIFYS